MNTKGKLKIFFGYCAGVGKTFAMLQEAQQKYVEGYDVVVGYIEPHDRKETTDLIYGLPAIQTKQIEYKGRIFQEFNLEEALQRKPEIILVDELAHTNVPGCIHEKRYSDVEELLNAGINVYTTINVQHIESLQDVVEGITRIKVNERIPDHIFDEADDIQFIDIETDELIKRLEEGKIYPKKRIHQALSHFFVKDNLIALRSIALKRSAQRIDQYMDMQKRPYVKEHILVCLSASPTNEKVIRTASRMAQAFESEFTALYVETEASKQMNDKNKNQLQSNIKLARHLKADLVSTYGNDIAYQISQYAKTSGVSKLVLGRSFQKQGFFKHTTIVDTLTKDNPNLDIYIIPDTRSIPQRKKEKITFSTKETLLTLLVLTITTLFTVFISYFFFDVTSITLIYVLASCLIGALTSSPAYSVISSLYSVSAINFLFIEPRFTFQMNSSRYILMLICLVVVSLTISTLTRKLRSQMELASQHAHAMDVLLEISQNLQRCNTKLEIMKEASYQLHRIFKKTIIYYPVFNQSLKKAYLYNDNLSEAEKEIYQSAKETAVAKWVYKNNKNAGVSTSTLPNSRALYLAIRRNNTIFAVVGLSMHPKESLSCHDSSLLKTILNEIALAYDSLN